MTYSGTHGRLLTEYDWELKGLTRTCIPRCTHRDLLQTQTESVEPIMNHLLQCSILLVRGKSKDFPGRHLKYDIYLHFQLHFDFCAADI